MARQAKLSERGRSASQALAKRRARSLKRETGGGVKKRAKARR
jgi:hypothetical protein